MNLLNAVSHTFDADGTRYELVLTQAPAGGLLVVWEAGRFVGRAHIERAGVRLITLAGKVGRPDVAAIQSALQAQRAALPWWTS